MFWTWGSSKPKPVAPVGQSPAQAELVFHGASRGARQHGHLDRSRGIGPKLLVVPRTSNVLGRTPLDDGLEPEDSGDERPSKPFVGAADGERNIPLSADAPPELRRVLMNLEQEFTSLFRTSTQIALNENAELRSQLKSLSEENSRLHKLLVTNGGSMHKVGSSGEANANILGTLRAQLSRQDLSADEQGEPDGILRSKSEGAINERIYKSASVQWGRESVCMGRLSVGDDVDRGEEDDGDPMQRKSTQSVASSVFQGRSMTGSVALSEAGTVDTTGSMPLSPGAVGPTPNMSINERAMYKTFKAWRVVVENRQRRAASKRKDSDSRAAKSQRITGSSGRYDLHQFWKDAGLTKNSKKSGILSQRPSAGSFTSGGGAGKTMRIKRMDKAMSDYSRRNRILMMFVQNPLSPRRMAWELMGIIFIVYDMIAIPLQVFDTPWDAVSTVMAWAVTCYWTLDIPASFLVGYHVDGVLEVRASRMIKHYVSTWFFADVVVITFDWILLIADMQDSSQVDHISYVKAGRSLRLLRFLRLIRLLKLRGVLTRILELITSEYLLTLLRVLKLLLFIVIINHFVACAWYGIGEDATESWVSAKFDKDEGFGYRYTTALHWSFTQFTPASMEVTPTNIGERTFNVFVVVMALIVFSSFVSSITEAMTRLRNLNALRAEQHSQLRRYFSENRIPPAVQTRVWRYLERAALHQRRKRQMWQDVALVHKLPEILQMELQMEAYNPTLAGYPFFHQYSDIDPVAMRAICHLAVAEASIAQGQDLFQRGQASDRMYFLTEGSLDYIMQDFEFNDFVKATLSAGTWAAEACVWIKWFHMGTMKARHDAEVFELQVKQLHLVMQQYWELLQACQKYATLFLERIREFDDYISDFECLDFDQLQTLAQKAFAELGEEDEELEQEYRSSMSSQEQRQSNRLSWNSSVSNVGASMGTAVAKLFKNFF